MAMREILAFNENSAYHLRITRLKYWTAHHGNEAITDLLVKV